MATVTLVNFDGSVLKKSPAFIENKTVSQILETIKNSFPNHDPSQYVLAVKTPAYIKILEPDLVTLSKYPSLITNSLTDIDSIPAYALMIYKKTEKDKMFITYKATSLNEQDIVFPPFYYGFFPEEFNNKNVSDLISDMTKHFGLQISNPKIFLNDQEVSSCDNAKKFIKIVTLMIQTQNSDDTNSCPVEFKFDIEQQGLKTVRMREKVLQEMFDTESTYFRYLTVLNNFIAPEFQKQKILKENDFQLFFGPIPSMIETSAYLANELNKLKSYSSCVSQIFSKFFFDFQKSSGEYFVNYNKKIKFMTEKLDSNSEVKKICQRSPDKGKFTLQSLLIMPIQRFPRYVLLLKELSKYTPESHPDFLPLNKVNENLSNIVHEMEEGHLVRGVSDIQERLEPLKGSNSIVSMDRILVEEFIVSIKDKKKTRSTLYLFNDLILLTTGIEREVEQMRSEYNDFFFIPNYNDPLTICYYFKDEYKVIEFNSNEQVKKFITVFNELRNKVFENNSHLSLPTIKAVEYFPPGNQIIPPLINCSCCRLYNSISIASHKLYMIFDAHHQSLTIANNIKNVHNYAKLVMVNDVPYIFGGVKKAGPFELFNNKFEDAKPKAPHKTDTVPEVINNTKSTSISPLKEGRIYHTCCVYDNCIVIYGGINPRSRNKFYSDVYFYNVENGQWFMSDPSIILPEPRYKHSAVVYKNLMIIHGGISTINQSALSDTWCYDFLNGKWKLLNFRNNRRIFPRFGHSAVIVNRYMFVIGGSAFKLNSQPISENNNNSENKGNESSDTDSNVSFDDGNAALLASCSFVKDNFCVNIETGHLTSIEIEGNFLTGLSLFTAIYDEINKKIFVFGGTDPHEKAIKGLPIITTLELPQRYTMESAKPPEGPVDAERITIVSSFLTRKATDSYMLINEAEDEQDNDNDNGERMNDHMGRRRKKNRCPLLEISSNPPPESPSLKSTVKKEFVVKPAEQIMISSSGSSILAESDNNLNQPQQQEENNILIPEQQQQQQEESNILIPEQQQQQQQQEESNILIPEQQQEEHANDNNVDDNFELNLKLGNRNNTSQEMTAVQQESVISRRSRKYNEIRALDDQDIRATIRISQPNISLEQRRKSLL